MEYGKNTMLIIDDDESIGNFEQELLERSGYAVMRAYSGTEAQLLLKKRASGTEVPPNS